MNKKFSTLMLGLLLTSAFASAQETPEVSLPQVPEGVQLAVEIGKDVVSGTYFVVGEADGKPGLTPGDKILAINKELGAYTLSLSDINLDKEARAAYTWSFEVKKEGTTNPQYFYALKNNEAGVYLTYDGHYCPVKVDK